MPELHSFEAAPAVLAALAAPGSLPPACEECLGSGGWFRYEPAVEASSGRLYLSCLQCRGSGRLELPRS